MIVLILIFWLSRQKIDAVMGRYRWVGALHHSDNSVTELQSVVGCYILDWKKIQKDLISQNALHSKRCVTYIWAEANTELKCSCKKPTSWASSDSIKEWIYLCLVLFWRWWAGSITAVLKTWQSMQNCSSTQSQSWFFHVTDCVLFFFLFLGLLFVLSDAHLLNHT